MSGPLELTLRPDVRAPRIARRALDEWFRNSLADDGFESAELLVSELVTNAVLHGQGTIIVRAHLDDDRLLVEVMDEGRGFERNVRAPDLEGIGGWGLRLVDSESSRWGVHEETTHVWFELERPVPPMGPRARRSPASTGRQPHPPRFAARTARCHVVPFRLAGQQATSGLTALCETARG